MPISEGGDGPIWAAIHAVEAIGNEHSGAVVRDVISSIEKGADHVPGAVAIAAALGVDAGELRQVSQTRVEEVLAKTEPVLRIMLGDAVEDPEMMNVLRAVAGMFFADAFFSGIRLEQEK